MSYTEIEGTKYYESEPVERYNLPPKLKRKISLNTSNQCQELRCYAYVLSTIMCKFVRVVLNPNLLSLHEYLDKNYSENFEDCDDLLNVTKCPNILRCLETIDCHPENIFYTLLFRIFYRFLRNVKENGGLFTDVSTILKNCEKMTHTKFFNFWRNPEELNPSDGSSDIRYKREQEYLFEKYQEYLVILYDTIHNLGLLSKRGEIKTILTSRARINETFIQELKKILELNLYAYLSVDSTNAGNRSDVHAVHALTIVGFDETHDVFFIKNSWGRGLNLYPGLIKQHSNGLGILSKYDMLNSDMIRYIGVVFPAKEDIKIFPFLKKGGKKYTRYILNTNKRNNRSKKMSKR